MDLCLPTGVVYTSLNAVIQGKATRGRLAPQLLVHSLGQHLGHMVVVQGKVWELLLQRKLHLVVVVAVLRHDCVSYNLCKDRDRP